MSEIKVGINGFGRIGRAVTRITQQDDRCRVVAVNDIDPNVKNHAYLFEYDSTYGQYNGTVVQNENSVIIDGNRIQFYEEEDISDVPWEERGVDVVVGASGVHNNVLNSHELVEEDRVQKVVITHQPDEGLDQAIIFGVNEDEYDHENHHVVGSSICDANALAPAINLLDEEFGVKQGFVTTLHPWLSYQNLVDGSVRSVSSPGHFWDDFQLGRASDKNLIPKDTTAVEAINAVRPEIPDKVNAMSFRIPTAIVSTSDVTIELEEEASTEEVNNLFERQQENQPRIFGYSEKPLVSSDFKQIKQSLVFDGRWTDVQDGKNLHMILWYDNEWGYSERVVDTVDLVVNGEIQPMNDLSRWVRHKTTDGPMWSPVPEDASESQISLAGPEPTDSAMQSYDPVGYDEINILPPADPTRVVGLAHNFHDLVNSEKGGEIEEPLLFLKTPSSVIGPGQNIEIPANGPTWAEVEVAFVVDKTARNVEPEEADEYIRGYTVANDVTREGIHNRNWHLPRSKARETFCPTGPHLVQGVETHDLKMETRINGERTQDSTTLNRIYHEHKALSIISSIMTLDPGDLILTGTPAGATDSIISPGDVTTVTVEGIGTLENPVVLSE
jgi:glyceraldehyde 3-phosphate dehydrogenase